MGKDILLSEILTEVSEALVEADARATSDGSATMQFEECEVELAFKAERNANGGLKIWLLNLGAGYKKTDSNTIKLKFKKIEDNPLQASAVEGKTKAPKIKRQ